jgi:hypothetical protein
MSGCAHFGCEDGKMVSVKKFGKKLRFKVNPSSRRSEAKVNPGAAHGLGPASDSSLGPGVLDKKLSDARERARRYGHHVSFSVDVSPDGKADVSPIQRVAALIHSILDEEGTIPQDLDRALSSARARGAIRVGEILSGQDMLSADQMARLLGTTRMTVNTKRRNHQLLGLDGAKRGFRFPEWQIGDDGKPFEALPALFDLLGGSPWAVYRFLVQRHAELGGLTGREALAKGRSAEAIAAADSVAEAFS